MEQLQREVQAQEALARDCKLKNGEVKAKAQKYREALEAARIELTLASEKLRQREAEAEGMRGRAEEAERARRERSGERAKLKLENEELRRQLEVISCIKVDTDSKPSIENQK